MTLLGYQTPEQVRQRMEKSDIYLVTSDRQEGWGAVVNEAMNSGCAVVANHMIGAVPFLIKHGKNGLIYQDGRKEALFRLTCQLLQDRDCCRRLGEAAFDTITKEWNAENAAERLCGLCVRLGFLRQEDVAEMQEETTDKAFGDEQVSYGTGPCSPAPVISERRMYRELMKDSMGR